MLFVGLAWVGTAGCLHQDPADRSIERLKGELTKVQADHDRFDERLGALEAAEQRREELEKPGSAAAPRRLPVVRFGGGDAGESPLHSNEGDPADVGDPIDEARPVVQLAGKATMRARRGRADEGSLEAKRDYESALSQLKSKQYDRALESFTAFLVRYPDHAYADNAMYWRGECFYAKGEYARASEQFEGLLARFPDGNKVSDALLKIGLCQQRLGSTERAQRAFTELREKYPKSEAARHIPHP